MNKREKRRLDELSSEQRDEMIKRLEREREKVNSEIEAVLRSYAKESGNRALKIKKRGRGDSVVDWNYAEEE